MCNALSIQEQQVEEQIKAFDLRTINDAQVEEIASLVHPFTVDIGNATVETNKDVAETLEYRAHVLEHLMHAIGYACGFPLSKFTNDLEQQAVEADAKMEEKEFETFLEGLQAQANERQHEYRVKEAQVLNAIVEKANPIDVADIFHAYSTVRVQAELSRIKQSVAGQMAGLLGGAMEDAEVEQAIH